MGDPRQDAEEALAKSLFRVLTEAHETEPGVQIPLGTRLRLSQMMAEKTMDAMGAAFKSWYARNPEARDRP